MLPDVQQLRIGDRVAGDGTPLFVVAEIGLNHSGSLERALALVDAAAAAGASAVKVQALTADRLVAPGAPAPVHVDAVSMIDFFQRFELDDAGYATIAARARARRLAFIATPLSLDAVDMLERVGTDAYKVASGDITWRALVEKIGATGKPVLVSTGMSTLAETEAALDWAWRAGAAGVAALHCVSAYPVPKGSENLRAIATLGLACGTLVGLSDHGPDTFAVPLAVAMGAAIYERHIVLEANDGSVDADVSSTPEEFATIVRTATHAAAALGTGVKTCQPAERGNLGSSRRGLYAVRPLSAGHVVTDTDLVALRPLVGIGADRQAWAVGRTIVRDVAAGAPLHDADVESTREGTAHVA